MVNIILLLLLPALFGCTGRQGVATDSAPGTDSIATEDSTARPEIVYMVLPNTHYPKDVGKVTLTLVNNTDRIVYAGLDYFIERRTDGRWTEWPLKYGGFDEPAFGASKGSPLRLEVDLANVRDEYVTGMYRLGKSISIGFGPGSRQDTCYCVFYIDE
mgnify:CR=1 FL=1